MPQKASTWSQYAAVYTDVLWSLHLKFHAFKHRLSCSYRLSMVQKVYDMSTHADKWYWS